MFMIIVVGLLVLAAILLLIISLSIYNGIIDLQHRVDKAWFNIDSLLKQRHDEIPKLVSVCKEYMHYEHELLHAITNAREEYQNASKLHEKMEWENKISQVMQRVLACVENYPDLKANKLYNYVFCRLKQLEDDIADARTLYNDYVKSYNLRVQSFPDVIIANLIGSEKALFFRIRGNSQLINNVTFCPEEKY